MEDSESVSADAVMHAGGVLQDAGIQSQNLAGIREVTAPKVAAITRLRETQWTSPTAQMVLFSSTASLLGPPGQANYAAANATLDAWAEEQTTQGA